MPSIRRAMAFEPEERYPDAGAMGRALYAAYRVTKEQQYLDAAASDKATSKKAPSWPRSRRGSTSWCRTRARIATGRCSRPRHRPEADAAAEALAEDADKPAPETVDEAPAEENAA